MKTISKTQIYLIIAGVALLIVIIIGIVIYRSGKKSGLVAGAINLSSPVNDNPNGAVTGPQASVAELKTLAQTIHDDMDGGNLTHNIDAWNRVLVLSDSDFIKLYNEFDFDFQKESGQTLRGWIESETSYYVPFLGTQWGSTKDALLARMNKLNLV